MNEGGGRKRKWEGNCHNDCRFLHSDNVFSFTLTNLGKSAWNYSNYILYKVLKTYHSHKIWFPLLEMHCFTTVDSRSTTGRFKV